MEKENLSIRGIDRNIWQQFRAKCVYMGVPVGDRLNYLLTRDVKCETTINDLLGQAIKEG